MLRARSSPVHALALAAGAVATVATVATVGACGGGHAGPSIGSTPSAPSASVSLEPAPEAGQPPERSLDDLAARGDTDATCFAWSPSGAVMCDVGEASIQDGAVYAVEVLGPTPARFTYLQSPKDEQFFEIDPAWIDRHALDEARAVVKAGDFRGWTGEPTIAVDVGESAQVGAFEVRRTRTVTGEDGDPETGVWDVATDVIELKCRDTWVPLSFDGNVFGNPIGEPQVGVVQVGGKLLFTAMVSWGMEGDSGGGSAAELIDPSSVCR
jgi:hypothetical protein